MLIAALVCVGEVRGCVHVCLGLLQLPLSLCLLFCSRNLQLGMGGQALCSYLDWAIEELMNSSQRVLMQKLNPPQ